MSIKKWLDVEFESSSSLTPEFAKFAREYKTAIKKLLSSNFELISFNRGHFDLSGFVKNKDNNKLVYISTSDVRYCSNSWYNSILIRTAEHEKDWTGGSNNFSSLDSLLDYITRLTK